jgi:hypothetical protein
MSDKQLKKDSLHVTSDPITNELVAIKDRLSAIETIQSISNATVVEAYVKKHLTTDKAQPIMKECETARTRSHLRTHFGFNSDAALDHHFKPLRDADLIRQRVEDDGTLVFEWSNMFRRLPKSSIKSLLGIPK